MEKYKLGNLEFAFKFVDADGNETIGVSTPAMWALAQEKLDCDRKSGNHTNEYITNNYVNYLALMTAKSIDLVNDDAPTMENIATLLNKYDVFEVSEDYPREKSDPNEVNPSLSDQEGGQGEE